MTPVHPATGPSRPAATAAGYPGAPGGGQPLQAEGKNFFAALFDYSFNSFATPGLIRVLYIIGTVVIAHGWLGYTVVFFQFSAVAGLITLIFGAVVALFGLAFLRVSLEFYYAVVRMSEDIHNRR